MTRFYDHTAYTELTAVALNALTGVQPPGTPVNPDVPNGNKVHNSPRGRTFVRVTNTDDTDSLGIEVITPTTVTEGSSGELDVENPTITLAKEESITLGPWTNNFEDNDPAAGFVTIDWTLNGSLAAADVEIETYKIV